MKLLLFTLVLIFALACDAAPKKHGRKHKKSVAEIPVFVEPQIPIFLRTPTLPGCLIDGVFYKQGI